MKPTRTRAWLLLAALALATAGCSQLEDAPDTGNRTGIATGNEPISISIAPKPGFEAGDAETRSGDADTRSTVDGNGVFAWVDGTDMIFAVLTFDDHQTNPTVFHHCWLKSSSASPIVAGWNVYNNWTQSASELTSMNWPVGASKCTVQAFHTNCKGSWSADGSGRVDFKYLDGMGDHMFFTGDFTVGNPLKVDFKHSTTRVTFAGLKASTKYRLQVNGVEPTFATSFKKKGFALEDPTTQTFITGAAATSFTICLPLTPATVADATIGIAAGEVKLTLLKVNADGTTTPINEAILNATGTSPDYVMNGNRYTVTVNEYAGGTNPDTDGNLLPTPPPVVNGADVYEINGYYVAKVANVWQWAVATGDANPCKVAGNGWRLPTMKDFETLAGWGTTNPWNAISPDTGSKALGTITTAFVNAFSSTNYVYLSSDSKDDTSLWVLKLLSNGNASYAQSTKSSAYHYVRCVQRKP